VYYGPTDEFHNIGLDIDNPDRGLGGVSGNSADDGKFLMPVLLNVELTAPYMHDGRFNTLEEVVEHYNSEIQPNPNLAGELRHWDGNPKKLNLSDGDKQALVAFHKSLTDPAILTDTRFSNPFRPRSN
jgi:cytochrome c peroxidase